MYTIDERARKVTNLSSRMIVCLFTLFALLSGDRIRGAEPVRIGLSASLSGKYLRPAQEQLNGIRMWVEDVNAQGGLLGRPVELIYYDDESDPQKGALLYRRLIVDDRVDLLLGPYSSGVTLAASSVAEDHDFPMVSAGASSSHIWERGYRNIFGLYTLGRTYMDQVLDFAKRMGLTRVALIYADAAFPRDVAEGVRETSARLGMTVVYEKSYGNSTTNFSSLIREMRFRRPEVVIGGSYLPDSTAFMRQAREHRLSADIFAFAVGPGLPDFGLNLGEDAEGVMGNTQWEATLKLPGTRRFVERYRLKYGHPPGYHAAGGYGAGQVLEAAVGRAGSLGREALREALGALDVVTVFGHYRVDAWGRQIGKPGYTVQWQDGERRVVLPPEVAVAPVRFPFVPWDQR